MPALAIVLMLLHSTFSSNYFEDHKNILFSCLFRVSLSMAPFFFLNPKALFLSTFFSFESQSLVFVYEGGVILLSLLSYHRKSFSEWRKDPASWGNPWKSLGKWGERLGWNVPFQHVAQTVTSLCLRALKCTENSNTLMEKNIFLSVKCVWAFAIRALLPDQPMALPCSVPPEASAGLVPSLTTSTMLALVHIPTSSLLPHMSGASVLLMPNLSTLCELQAPELTLGERNRTLHLFTHCLACWLDIPSPPQLLPLHTQAL